MNKVILDDEMRAKLNGAETRLEVCDPTGKVVGQFIPESEYQHLQKLLDQFLPPPMTPEERAAALQEYRDGKFLTTAQVLARLEQVRRDWESRK